MSPPFEVPAAPEQVLPEDVDALLVGRLFDPAAGGPSIVTVRDDEFVDITSAGPTVSDLLERPDAARLVRESEGGRRWPVTDVLAATAASDTASPHLLAPVDLQVLKAAGVTFVDSMLERVIEERAGGVAQAAEEIRVQIGERLGERLGSVRAGSPQALELLAWLREQGLWSQYLEVGLGPDAEVFTKGPVLSAVGYGAPIGVAEVSDWNNPEPELVLVVNSAGTTVGATLGNDVNLRDIEGRSALLLPQAKDNNAATALGPVIRLFDGDFGVDDVRTARIDLSVRGQDGFTLDDSSNVARISRSLESLVEQSINRRHPYPDGLVLFTGTLFAPTKDRDQPGGGFTHHEGDLVEISTPLLGALRNPVTTSEKAPPWDSGIRQLYANLAARGLLAVVA
jgi:fumarylacetoacetate (FAA) hydrolase family protein